MVSRRGWVLTGSPIALCRGPGHGPRNAAGTTLRLVAVCATPGHAEKPFEHGPGLRSTHRSQGEHRWLRGRQICVGSCYCSTLAGVVVLCHGQFMKLTSQLCILQRSNSAVKLAEGSFFGSPYVTRCAESIAKARAHAIAECAQRQLKRSEVGPWRCKFPQFSSMTWTHDMSTTREAVKLLPSLPH